ncbi:putative uncharacterized protein encoded by LINC00313 [Pongo pygmaeus]|uniref:putative uncharacterized protein encoded by LINC00313 n=1 Tax=Pongo pygmaeus TaxID=9600 RepID=UPI0023E2020C|nr:putative uncharacterized protein encoded by LINC00313 [Pongo pygmaeus]
MTTLRKSKQPSAAGNLDEQTPGECSEQARRRSWRTATMLTWTWAWAPHTSHGAADPWEAPAPWIEKPDVKECLGRMSCRRLA